MQFVLPGVSGKMEIELIFAQNDFLMTVPYNATTQSGRSLEIKTQTLDWEVSLEEVQRSRKRIRNLIESQQRRTWQEKEASDFEGLLIQIQQFCRNSRKLEESEKAGILTVVQEQFEWYDRVGGEATIAEFQGRVADIHNQIDDVIALAKEKEAKPIVIEKIKKTVRGAETVLEKVVEGGGRVSVEKPKQQLNEIIQWMEQNDSQASVKEVQEKRLEVKKIIMMVKRRARAVKILPDGKVELGSPDEELL
jgi:uncharacterized protein YdcH (DUF465 family)